MTYTVSSGTLNPTQLNLTPVLQCDFCFDFEPLDRFSPFVAQTTCFCTRKCLLGVPLLPVPIKGVKSPQNFNFGGVNRRFQA